MRPVNSIDELLEHMVARDASDLHVTVGTPPVIRVRGEVERLDEFAPLTSEDTQQLLYRILSSEQQKQLEIKRQLDFSHSIPGLARFRVNVYFQRESIGAAFRLIPAELKTLEELGMPSTLHLLADKPRGLVLVTGPTGSGKSTTLAASDRRDQPEPFRAHPHDRGPDRVPAPPQALHRQPARDRPGCRRASRKRSAPPCARTRT